jgi:hypothetical protein
MTVKHNSLLNLIVGCLYVSFFGLHISVILVTIIRSIRAKEIAMQQRFSLNVMGSQYVLHCTVQWLLYYEIVRNIKIYKNVKDLKTVKDVKVAYHCLPQSLCAAPPYYDYLEFLL